MESRIVKLESEFSYLQEEIKELKVIHKEEIGELKRSFVKINETLKSIQGDIEYFRQTHNQVKYFIMGGALIWIAKEIGIVHSLKLLIGIL